MMVAIYKIKTMLAHEQGPLNGKKVESSLHGNSLSHGRMKKRARNGPKSSSNSWKVMMIC